MRVIVHSACKALLVLLTLAFVSGIPSVHAADKRLIVTKGADYGGFDYRTVKDVTFDACQAACLNDSRCKALTFNEKAGWCFLKSDFGGLSAATSASAARVVVVPPVATSVTEQRIPELNFLSGGQPVDAERFARTLGTRYSPPVGMSYEALRQSGIRARAAGNPDDAASAGPRAHDRG